MSILNCSVVYFSSSGHYGITNLWYFYDYYFELFCLRCVRGFCRVGLGFLLEKVVVTRDVHVLYLAGNSWLHLLLFSSFVGLICGIFVVVLCLVNFSKILLRFFLFLDFGAIRGNFLTTTILGTLLISLMIESNLIKE